MEPPKFRYWATEPYNRLVYRNQSENMVGVHPNMRQVTNEEMLTSSFRQEHYIMLGSGILDINQQEIYEGDVLEVIESRSPRLTTSFHAYAEQLPVIGFMVQNAHPFPLEQGLDCIIIANFYESPRWIQQFGGDKRPALAKRWAR